MTTKSSNTGKRARSEPENAATLPQPSNLHKWLKFTRIHTTTRNDWNEKLLELRNKPVEVAKNLNWVDIGVDLGNRLRRSLLQIFELDGYRIESGAWETLFGLRAPIYEELCLEFHSTYTLKADCTEWSDPNFLTFRLGGVARCLSLIEFAVRMGLYTREQVASPIFGVYMDTCVRLPTRRFNAQETWAMIGNGVFKSSTTPAVMIRSPFLKLVHKLLAYSITHRNNGRDKVKKNELWFMAHISDDDSMVNVPFALAHYLSKASGQRSESAICGGHYITILAESFHILSQKVKRELRLVPHEMRFIDKSELNTAGIIGQPQPHPQPQPQTQTQAEGIDEDDDDDDDGDGGEPYFAPTFYPPRHFRPTIQTLHQDMQALQYQMGEMRFSQDWMQHNMQRWFDATPGFRSIPYQPPPAYGTPGAVFPPPRYDRFGYPDDDMGSASSSHDHDSEPHQDDLDG